MRYCLLAVVVGLLIPGAYAAPRAAIDPFESDTSFIPTGPIDEQLLASLEKHGLTPAPLCSDAVFIRRVYLDLLGTLPGPEEVRTFLENTRPNKRTGLIDRLMEREEFADYQALQWCDALRVKSEFPINLWPNAVQAYHRWIRDAVRTNMSYDQFARELLTSSGSNFRVPPVNFYRAIQGNEPANIAAAVALTFMGDRMETWPDDRRAGMAAMFSRVAYKRTAEWKEEIVYLDPSPGDPIEAVMPDGSKIVVPLGEDPRRVFADWLIADDNPWFARAVVNRVWSLLLGRGLIHEPDDIRPDNPPVHPELLACLEDEFVRSKYDVGHLQRLILNSRTYQQSSIPAGDDVAEAQRLFACYPTRRLDAEVLIDALCRLTGTTESYSSPIPEPFTFIPERNRTIELADGSITSSFLEMFGRPSRDTGLWSERNNSPTDAQRLHLMNSSHIQKKIDNGWRMRRVINNNRRSAPRLIGVIYMSVLSRRPTENELDTAEKYFTSGRPDQAASDLVWALINSKEFLYRH